MMVEDWGSAMKALGQATRLKIVLLLARQEHCVCELERVFPTSQSAISQHLRILRSADLVTERREGQWVFYNLNRTKLKEILTSFVQALDDPTALAGDMEREWRLEASLTDDPLVPAKLRQSQISARRI